MNDIQTKETTQVQESTSIMQVIERAAMNPDVDIDKMERLLQMQERILDRNAESAFNSAMSHAQSEMRRINADSDNPQTRSKYASYAAIDRELRPIYTNHGFSLSFGTEESISADMARVICCVAHIGGYSKTYHIDMPADGKGPKGGDVMTKTHAVGAAMSYGMRYLLKMIFNVAIGEDDTDGNYPIERISPEQIANIEALITETESDRFAFCKYMKTESIDKIQKCEYDRAIAALEAKRAHSV